MKFICNRQNMSDALVNVSKAVSTKSNLPILEGILLKATDDKIYLCGYNLELAITTEIEANVLIEGNIVINARLLSEMVKKISSTDLSVSVDSNFLTTIKGDITEFSIMGYDFNEYPELPIFEGDSITEIDGETFKSMIEQTIFSVAITDQKPVHTGILFEIEDDTFKMVAVDGFRLALRKEKTIKTSNHTFIVPSKTLSEISKLIKDDEMSVSIIINKKNIVFKVNDYHIMSRLLEGDFLDYKNVLNTSFVTQVIVSKKAFLDAVDRASLIINDRVKSPVVISFNSDDKIKISCATSIGKVYDALDCTLTGDELKIGFNNKYMIDALRACHDDNIKILLNGPLSPIKIVPIEGDEFLFLVLPVRLRDE